VRCNSTQERFYCSHNNRLSSTYCFASARLSVSQMRKCFYYMPIFTYSTVPLLLTIKSFLFVGSWKKPLSFEAKPDLSFYIGFIRTPTRHFSGEEKNMRTLIVRFKCCCLFPTLSPCLNLSPHHTTHAVQTRLIG